MLRGLSTKAGAWVKPGKRATDNPTHPGSYGDYIYVRAAPASYPKTEQQKRIAAAGRKCKGSKNPQECIIEQFK